MSDLCRDLRHALDPAAFARETLGFAPDPWQERAFRWSGKRLLLNCSRQSGKSTVAAILALHSALFTPDTLVLLVSPSLRQSGELFRKVTTLLTRLPHQPRRTEENRLSFAFANGSRVVSLPSSEHTVRGYSKVALVIEDEAAWVPDELYHAVRPMLAVSDGRLVLMSTPCGKRGHFHREWVAGGDVWERVRITAHEVPRISSAFLAEERRSLGGWRFAQEYLCEFSETVDQVFSYEHVSAAISAEMAGIRDSPSAADVIVGADLGQSRDHTAIAVVECCRGATAKPRRKPKPFIIRGTAAASSLVDADAREPLGQDVVLVRHIERMPLGTPYTAVVARLAALMASPRYDKTPTLVVDASGVGRPVVELLESASLHPIRVTITGGEVVSGAGSDLRVPKRDLVSALQLLLQQQRLKVATDAGQVAALVDELLGFRVRLSAKSGHDSYAAATEAVHDDLLMALALACWQARGAASHRASMPLRGMSEVYNEPEIDDATWVCGPSRPQSPEERPGARFVAGGVRGLVSPHLPPAPPRPFIVR